MDCKKWLLGSLAVFVVYSLLDYVIHSLILMGVYEATMSVWRPMEEYRLWISLVKNMILALLFVYIFTKGYEGKGIMEGVRFGLWIGLLIWVPVAYAFYNILPIPYSIAWQWWIYGTIQCVICGLAASLIYKPAESK
ncbi:hypothetical protein ACFL7D_06090 [candidate division KSB1 bacterium]